jgi:hypothetical protein
MSTQSRMGMTPHKIPASRLIMRSNRPSRQQSRGGRCAQAEAPGGAGLHDSRKSERVAAEPQKLPRGRACQGMTSHTERWHVPLARGAASEKRRAHIA